MVDKSHSGPEAEGCDQRQLATVKLAQNLVAVLGYEGALIACQKNSWDGVRKEVARNRRHPCEPEDDRSLN